MSRWEITSRWSTYVLWGLAALVVPLNLSLLLREP
jgi:hypothetical protein